MRAALAAAAALLFWAGAISGEPRRADAARLMNELMSGRAEVGGPFTGTGADRMAAMLRETL